MKPYSGAQTTLAFTGMHFLYNFWARVNDDSTALKADARAMMLEPPLTMVRRMGHCEVASLLTSKKKRPAMQLSAV